MRISLSRKKRKTNSENNVRARDFITETAQEEAWELVLQPVPEIQAFVKQMGLGNDEKSVAEIASRIDAIPDQQLPAASIPRLKNLTNKPGEGAILQTLQGISGRPDAAEQYIQLMQKRDSAEGRQRDHVSGLMDQIRSGQYESPVLLKLPTGLYVIGGRTRLYAALALGVPTKVKIIGGNTFVKQDVAEGDKMSRIDLGSALANTPPEWQKFVGSLPPQLAREFVDERPRPDQDDIDFLTPLRLVSPQPVSVRVADLLKHPENQGTIGRSPDDVVAAVNQRWRLKIPSGKKYDPNPARYRAYAQMTPGTASPSVMADGVILFGAGRFVAAALRGDETMRVWSMTKKQGVQEVKILSKVKGKGSQPSMMPKRGLAIRPDEETRYLGQQVGKIAGYPLYRDYLGGQVSYQLFDPESRTVIVVAFGSRYKGNPQSLIVSGLYAAPGNPVRAAKFYRGLILDQGLTLISDRNQSPGGQRVWQQLESYPDIEVYGYDTGTGEVQNFGAKDTEMYAVPSQGVKGSREMQRVARDLRLVATAR